jgi:hypothetical protein
MTSTDAATLTATIAEMVAENDEHPAERSDSRDLLD